MVSFFWMYLKRELQGATGVEKVELERVGKGSWEGFLFWPSFHVNLYALGLES